MSEALGVKRTVGQPTQLLAFHAASRTPRTASRTQEDRSRPHDQIAPPTDDDRRSSTALDRSGGTPFFPRRRRRTTRSSGPPKTPCTSARASQAVRRATAALVWPCAELKHVFCSRKTHKTPVNTASNCDHPSKFTHFFWRRPILDNVVDPNVSRTRFRPSFIKGHRVLGDLPGAPRRTRSSG